MPQHRFSPRPNRADEISWRGWGREPFAEAAASDRPILLCLTAVWCHWCHLMDETTYSDPGLIALINDNFVAIRVDADQFPHVHDRYIAGGWPTNAFLTPTGEVLWAGTYIEPEQLRSVAESVRNAWTERRAELGLEIERRRKALDAARGRVSTIGLVRREPADDVLNAVLETFDPRNGGFGEAPKYTNADAVELLLLRGPQNPDEQRLAIQSLEGMLAGELWDDVEGGFFRYALNADWTVPAYEKLLSVNAELVRCYAIAAQVTGRADFRTVVERTVAWGATLQLPSGLWGGSQAAEPDYYRAENRSVLAPPARDLTVYTSANAQWIAALADAGGRLGRPEWIAQAEHGLGVLLDTMAAPNDLLYHYLEPGGTPQVPALLLDVLETARACIVLAQAAGSPAHLTRARRLMAAMEKAFWADDGGFFDRTRTSHDVGVLRYRDRPFDQNSNAARVLLDLVHGTGERSYRALAERTLALLSPMAGRYGVAGAGFAIAVHDFFEPPVQVFVVGRGPAADELRAAALALPVPGRRVWPLPDGGRVGAQSYQPAGHPVAYVIGPRGASLAARDPAALAAAARAAT